MSLWQLLSRRTRAIAEYTVMRMVSGSDSASQKQYGVVDDYEGIVV